MARHGSHPSHRVSRHRSRVDHGQAAPLLLVIVAVIIVGLVGLAEYGHGLAQTARARAAADASALAGTIGGRGAATRVAAANGARLVSFAAHGDTIVVEVVVGEAHATAAATDRP
jgi:Flp pilus assembly protein TadG